nr:MAG TPA: Complement C5-like protein [Caudoviricetes sp.]
MRHHLLHIFLFRLPAACLPPMLGCSAKTMYLCNCKNGYEQYLE